MDWIVYILECKDKTLYTGITNNLDARLESHIAGTGAKYTRSRDPFIVKYTETFPDRAQASIREYAIKRMSRQDKIALIAHAQ